MELEFVNFSVTVNLWPYSCDSFEPAMVLKVNIYPSPSKTSDDNCIPNAAQPFPCKPLDEKAHSRPEPKNSHRHCLTDRTLGSHALAPIACAAGLPTVVVVVVVSVPVALNLKVVIVCISCGCALGPL